MRHIFKNDESQKKISEFMLDNDEICMSDLLAYIVNHLSKYGTMHEVINEYQAENGRKFSVRIKDE